MSSKQYIFKSFNDDDREKITCRTFFQKKSLDY